MPHEHVRAGAIEYLSAFLAFAGSLGAGKAVVHATTDAWGPAWDDERLTEAILSSLTAAADEAGVELCVENVPGGPIDTADSRGCSAPRRAVGRREQAPVTGCPPIRTGIKKCTKVVVSIPVQETGHA